MEKIASSANVPASTFAIDTTAEFNPVNPTLVGFYNITGSGYEAVTVELPLYNFKALRLVNCLVAAMKSYSVTSVYARRIDFVTIDPNTSRVLLGKYVSTTSKGGAREANVFRSTMTPHSFGVKIKQLLTFIKAYGEGEGWNSPLRFTKDAEFIAMASEYNVSDGLPYGLGTLNGTCVYNMVSYNRDYDLTTAHGVVDAFAHKDVQMFIPYNCSSERKLDIDNFGLFLKSVPKISQYIKFSILDMSMLADALCCKNDNCTKKYDKKKYAEMTAVIDPVSSMLMSSLKDGINEVKAKLDSDIKDIESKLQADIDALRKAADAKKDELQAEAADRIAEMTAEFKNTQCTSATSENEAAE